MEIRVPRSAVASQALSSLLQRGADCPASTPTTVTEFVTRQLGWEPEYLRDRISTIFLDGKVVDDPDTAVVQDGALLGLSAAMPGLVGATLRRSGYYARMRSEISWGSDSARVPDKWVAGTVRVRLFNLILTEKADAVMARGVLVDSRQLAALVGDAWLEMQCVLANGANLLRIVDEPGENQE